MCGTVLATRCLFEQDICLVSLTLRVSKLPLSPISTTILSVAGILEFKSLWMFIVCFPVAAFSRFLHCRGCLASSFGAGFCFAKGPEVYRRVRLGRG